MKTQIAENIIKIGVNMKKYYIVVEPEDSDYVTIFDVKSPDMIEKLDEYTGLKNKNETLWVWGDIEHEKFIEFMHSD